MEVRIEYTGQGVASASGGVSSRPWIEVDYGEWHYVYLEGNTAHLDRPKPLVPTIVCRTGEFELGKWMAKATCSECGWWEMKESFTALTQSLGTTCHKKPPHERCQLPRRRT